MEDELTAAVPDDGITAHERRAALPLPVTSTDLAAFAETFSDLTEPEVMAGVWH